MGLVKPASTLAEYSQQSHWIKMSLNGMTEWKLNGKNKKKKWNYIKDSGEVYNYRDNVIIW